MATDDQGLAARFPIPLNEAQQQAIKDWAADDRLWTTQDTVVINLTTFACVILNRCQPMDEAKDDRLAPIEGLTARIAWVEQEAARGEAQSCDKRLPLVIQNDCRDKAVFYRAIAADLRRLAVLEAAVLGLEAYTDVGRAPFYLSTHVNAVKDVARAASSRPSEPK
jgi:hypothetical protein